MSSLFHTSLRRAAGSAAAGAIVLALTATAAQAATVTYGYSPQYQYFTVPAGVTSVHFDVIGGSGADGPGTYGGGAGGSGAEVIGDAPVSAGQVLTLWPGGAGQPGGGAGYGDPNHDDFEGGSGGTTNGAAFGGGNGGGGGAASYIKVGTSTDVVAGGGGGGGGSGTLLAGLSTGGGNGSGAGKDPNSDNLYAGTDAGATAEDYAYGGAANATSTDNGADGMNGGANIGIGGGGGGGGGGYAGCDGSCYSAGGGGLGGDASLGGGGGAGGDSYASVGLSNVSFGRSGSAGSAGQITLSFGASSALTLTASSPTSYPGQSVSFHAFADPTDGGGTVSFTSDGSAIPGCTNLAFVSGAGSDWEVGCTTSSLGGGGHTIRANYSGDSVYSGSSASTTETVYQSATSTLLSASPSTATVNATVTLTAHVYSSDGGGSVTFTQNGATLPGCGQVQLTGSGGSVQAICKTGWTQPGSETVLAGYSGDAGYASSSASTTVTVNYAPTVSSVSPKAGPAAGGQTVTITGSHLTGATAVHFGTLAATNVKVISDTTVTATAPAHKLPTTVAVTVTTPGGMSPVTTATHYTYDAAPKVSAIAPATGPAGTLVIVTGTGFLAGAKVAFGTTPATKVTRVSATQLKVTVPAGTGTAALSVTTAGGTSASTPADVFTYTGS